MLSHEFHIFQSLDVRYFGPLKTTYGSQIENMLRLGTDYLTNGETLPDFLVAHW
jgi:hypothetical protein